MFLLKARVAHSCLSWIIRPSPRNKILDHHPSLSQLYALCCGSQRAQGSPQAFNLGAVDDLGIDPSTSALSKRRSPTELIVRQ